MKETPPKWRCKRKEKSLDVKTIAIVSLVMAALLCPLSGFSAYPTMDRAMELFGTNRISTMGVFFEAEAYSEFARDLRCQTTPESARVMETFLLNSVTSIVVTVSTNNVNDGTRAWLLYDRGVLVLRSGAELLRPSDKFR